MRRVKVLHYGSCRQDQDQDDELQKLAVTLTRHGMQTTITTAIIWHEDLQTNLSHSGWCEQPCHEVDQMEQLQGKNDQR